MRPNGQTAPTYAGERILVDTGAWRIQGRGIRAVLASEDGMQVIYLRLGTMGWIRIDSIWLARHVAAALDGAIRESLEEARKP